MTTSSTPSAFLPASHPGRRRSRDRRAGIADVLARTVQALSAPTSSAVIVDALRTALRPILPVRRFELHDAFLRGADEEDRQGLCRLTLSLPATVRPVSLIVELAEDVEPDDWDVQLLEALKHLVTLAVLVERKPGPGLVASGGVRTKVATASPPLIGSSPAIKKVVDDVLRVASRSYTVLLLGESGTGKELFARLIHARSDRKDGPFVAVNCAAIVDTLLEAELFGIEDRTATGVRGRPGKFEEAQGGTIFLDEVGDLSKTAQAKLLRVLQDPTIERVGGHQSRRFDVRVVAATNQDLMELVERRRFRTDLYHRLAGIDVTVPPLRERGEDVIELARHFLAIHAPDRDLRLTTSAEDALCGHRWTGNVRELERVIQRLIIFADGDEIDVDQIPPAISQRYRDTVITPARSGDTASQWFGRLARYVLEQADGNKTEACRRLGISFHTLQRHLRKPVPPPRQQVQPDK